MVLLQKSVLNIPDGQKNWKFACFYVSRMFWLYIMHKGVLFALGTKSKLFTNPVVV